MREGCYMGDELFFDFEFLSTPKPPPAGDSADFEPGVGFIQNV